MRDLVWYACYGSNLLIKRFLCYLQGGMPEGSSKSHQGCSDKKYPEDSKQVIIPYELYFSKQSKSWENKGVAFIRSQKDKRAKTLSRMYLITKEQFVEIVRQESGRSPLDKTINIDFETEISKKQYVIPNILWYSRIMFLGFEKDHPIFTFTGKWGDEDIVLNPPGEKYLKVLIKGIKEVYNLSDKRIIEYLKKSDGAKGKIDEKEITEIMKSVSL